MIFPSILGPYLQHIKVPGLGVELKLQLHQEYAQEYGMWAASVTYATACSNAESSLAQSKVRNWTWILRDICQFLNPLGHNRNFKKYFFFEVQLSSTALLLLFFTIL